MSAALTQLTGSELDFYQHDWAAARTEDLSRAIDVASELGQTVVGCVLVWPTPGNREYCDLRKQITWPILAELAELGFDTKLVTSDNAETFYPGHNQPPRHRAATEFSLTAIVSW